ncbi:hypothetical protein OBBRIDRAFT_830148 [Obba rivulosa]|uniref:Uncharacterized protein n=1 Tax=Obba rivulosa TaxID=1052685 RepID=A0A8E2DUK9_9APHY|nr:hypothetical protein OBBRIDRAFT_830148 [Obba rivulosa]
MTSAPQSARAAAAQPACAVTLLEYLLRGGVRRGASRSVAAAPWTALAIPRCARGEPGAGRLRAALITRFHAQLRRTPRALALAPVDGLRVGAARRGPRAVTQCGASALLLEGLAAVPRAPAVSGTRE